MPARNTTTASMRKSNASNNGAHEDSSELWGSFNFSEKDLIDSAVNDGDFFLMEDEVNAEDDTSTSEPNEDHWGLSEEIEQKHPYNTRQSKRSDRPTSLTSDADDEKPHAPVIPFDRQPSTPILPEMAELQLQYQRTLMRFTKSMRRSDQTRSIVKRQRNSKIPVTVSRSFDHDDGDDDDDTRVDFFDSARCKELEETRRRVYQMLHTSSAITFLQGDH